MAVTILPFSLVHVGTVTERVTILVTDAGKSNFENYLKAKGKECNGGDVMKEDWPTLKDAILNCNSDMKCSGVYDANCDGQFISTCKVFTPSAVQKIPSKGCYYKKKGKNRKSRRYHTAILIEDRVAQLPCWKRLLTMVTQHLW